MGVDRSLQLEMAGVMKTILLTQALSLGLAVAASATMLPAQLRPVGLSVTTVAMGDACGPLFFRGQDGRCHPATQVHSCPKGSHPSPDGKTCWPG